MRRSIIGLGLGLLLVLAAVGIASATSAHGGAAKKPHARISAFHRPFHPTRNQRAQRTEIRREFRQAPRESAVASTAYDSARTVTIPDTETDVWIAPDDGGGVCTFIADPLNGYGSACHTSEVIANGQAATMLIVGEGDPLSGKALVAIVEPDGAAPPTVRAPNGATRELPLEGNLATGLVNPGDTLESNGNEIVVPQPIHRDCAPPEPGESFRRCS
jgi:hypothetical protein